MKTKKARFVLVNIEEPKQVLYTEEEVREMLLQCCEDITYPETYYEPGSNDEANEAEWLERFNKWFEENRKK